MAPTEPMMPSELAPEHAAPPPRLSLSDSGGEYYAGDMSASAASLAMSHRSRSPSKSGWRTRIGLGGVARRTLGISLLLVTVCLWTTSNFLASYIFSDHTYTKPFFVVYVNTSAFALSLVPMFLHFVIKHGVSGVKASAKQVWDEQWRGRGPHKTPAEEDDDDGTAGERLLMDDDGSLDDPPEPTSHRRPDRLSLRETGALSLEFCLLWFLANYFASACLEYTSVGSVTILTSTSSVWTLVFGAAFRVEPFSARKLIGVLASLSGIILISTVDLSGSSDQNRGNFPHKTRAQIAVGDAMAFVSAGIYGLYVTVMKRRVGNEDRVNMPLFFGLVGLFNLVLLWPGFLILHFTGVEKFGMPPSGFVWGIIVANSISSFISDMSWAYAMLLTTPLIVTVGLSLTIPLSLVGEMIQYNQYSSALYWIGAAIVLVSFLFINHESKEEGEGHPAPEADSRTTTV